MQRNLYRSVYAFTDAHIAPKNNFKGATNIVYHRKSDGTFEDVSAKTGIADPEGKGLGVA